eukprot:TRINITY_DN2596_c0_g1_i1.p1 TRINITY_DN2596_c0_g1~~TRINITY_DN2596_c0_g1_i1.p1  ORF type:complete len:180 (+),score=52.53 TRINITY_DN2596_c0_g1_i1:308-847(+)
MGNILSFDILSFFKTQKAIRLLVLGLDAAGKTTLLYRLRLGETTDTIPTVGFNVETVEYANISFTMWDVGGQEKIRALWRHYYSGVQGLIYVVDSADVERLDEAKEELQLMMGEPELRDTAVLVLANKQDLPGAASVSTIANKLELDSLRGRKWNIQSCCATKGTGLYEGMDWISRTIG